MSTRTLRRRLAIPATLVVSVAGTGAAIHAACSGDESPVPDAGVGTITSRDAHVDGTPGDAPDAGLTPDAALTPDAPIIPDAPFTPPDATVALDAAPDADPIG